MRAMILAAGRGTRMRELTAERPKPLLDVGGRSLIERQVDALVAAGVAEIVVNLAYGRAAIRAALGAGERWHVPIRYSDEGDAALETGGGILRALPLLGDEPFIVANADVLTDFSYATLMAGPQRNTLVLVDNPTHHPVGDYALAQDGRLSATGERLTYAGIALLEPSLFVGWPAGRGALKPMLDAALTRGELWGRRHAGLWIDVGTPERLAEARRRVGTPLGAAEAELDGAMS